MTLRLTGNRRLMDTIFVLNCSGMKGTYFLLVTSVGLLEYELKISILNVPLLFNGSFSKCNGPI
jgi:hypothetical protein